MNRKLLLILIFALVTLSFSFAGGTVEGHGSGQLNHSTVNNDNFFWDISVPTNNSTLPTSEFSSVPADGIGVIRIRANNDIAGTATIKALGDNWNFIHENNYTMKQPYELEAYKITFSRKNSKESFSVVGSPQKINLTKVGDTYSFTMEAGEFREIDLLVYRDDYCTKYYEYEFRLVLPSNTETHMEPGDYYANIKVDIPYGETYGERNIVNYRLKGRFGESSSDNADFAFMVQSNEQTYNFNLLDYTYRSVANASFYATRVANNPNETVEKNRYKVYLSPFPHLDDDGASANNPYYFIKYDTENQPRTTLNTVYYEVASDYRGTKWKTLDSAHPHTYILPITMTPEDLVGKRKNLTWKFTGGDKIGIYIKPTQNSGITPSSGLYYTNLYFYVESN